MVYYICIYNVTGNDNMKSKHKHAKFRLKGYGENASLKVDTSERVPLMLTDIQGLLFNTLLGNTIYQPSRWYAVEKKHLLTKSVCLVVEGISIQHWMSCSQKFKHCSKIFKEIFEIVTPAIYGGSLIQELAAVPLSEMEKESLIKRYGNMNLALEIRKDLMLMMKAVFPIKKQSNNINKKNEKDKFPRTQLLLSVQQLVEENYPLPLKGKLKNIYSDYVMTKDCYQPVTADSPMYAMDCEMCMTSVGSELTRISIVDENHCIVYESLVKPYNNITDYLTQYSGINKSLLENVTKRIEDVQNDLKELLPPDAILVGQSLNIDLHALKMMHPYIIDTSYIFNFTGQRSRKPKLKTLAREFLNEDIQEGKHGHCPVEDSLACLKLVQLKLNNSPEFGDAVHTSKKIEYKNIINNKGEEETQYASTIFNHLIQQRKKTLIVGCDDIIGDYHTYLEKANECTMSQAFSKKGKPKKVKLITVDSQKEIITTISEKIVNFDFLMGHLKLNSDDDKDVLPIDTLDKWIAQIYENLKKSTLFVVLFTGTVKENGIAMVNIK